MRKYLPVVFFLFILYVAGFARPYAAGTVPEQDNPDALWIWSATGSQPHIEEFFSIRHPDIALELDTIPFDLLQQLLEYPPSGTMDGAEFIESGYIGQPERENPATRVVDLFPDPDQIEFVVGTRINDAYQDPNMPVELEIQLKYRYPVNGPVRSGRFQRMTTEKNG